MGKGGGGQMPPPKWSPACSPAMALTNLSYLTAIVLECLQVSSRTLQTKLVKTWTVRIISRYFGLQQLSCQVSILGLGNSNLHCIPTHPIYFVVMFVLFILWLSGYKVMGRMFWGKMYLHMLDLLVNHKNTVQWVIFVGANFHHFLD